MLKLLKLSFLPKSPDYGLLILRVTLGFSMLLLHGRGKMLNFSATVEKMNGLMGLPGNVNAGLAVFAEVVCSALIIAGLFTRFAALMLAITMGVAFFIVHKSALVDIAASGVKSGELAMIYLVAYVSLLFTGAGKFSVDRG
ncbi:MAG: DoxX family protein [Prosthecobacter sp.]